MQLTYRIEVGHVEAKTAPYSQVFAASPMMETEHAKAIPSDCAVLKAALYWHGRSAEIVYGEHARVRLSVKAYYEGEAPMRQVESSVTGELCQRAALIRDLMEMFADALRAFVEEAPCTLCGEPGCEGTCSGPELCQSCGEPIDEDKEDPWYVLEEVNRDYPDGELHNVAYHQRCAPKDKDGQPMGGPRQVCERCGDAPCSCCGECGEPGCDDPKHSFEYQVRRDHPNSLF